MNRPHTIGWIGALLVAPLLLTIAGPLGAETTGWYVELRHGRSSLDTTFGTGILGSRYVDDESDASSAELGYRFNRFLGLQGGYHDLGAFRGTSAVSPCPPDEACPLILVSLPLEAEVSGWSLAAVPAWPWNDRFALYGKLGALDWRSDLTNLEGPPLGVWRAESYSDTDLLTAVGARYRFAGGLGVLLERQWLDLDLGSIALGLSWKF